MVNPIATALHDVACVLDLVVDPTTDANDGGATDGRRPPAKLRLDDEDGYGEMLFEKAMQIGAMEGGFGFASGAYGGDYNGDGDDYGDSDDGDDSSEDDAPDASGDETTSDDGGATDDDSGAIPV